MLSTTGDYGGYLDDAPLRQYGAGSGNMWAALAASALGAVGKASQAAPAMSGRINQAGSVYIAPPPWASTSTSGQFVASLPMLAAIGVAGAAVWFALK